MVGRDLIFREHAELYRRAIGVRKHADQWLLRKLRDSGMLWFNRWTVYLAVRLFCGRYWGRSR